MKKDILACKFPFRDGWDEAVGLGTGILIMFI